MKRFFLVFGVTLVFSAAGFYVHRALRAPLPSVAAEPVPDASDAERGYDALLSAGEKALSKGQVGAAQLALQSVPETTRQAARRRALADALTRSADAGRSMPP